MDKTKIFKDFGLNPESSSFFSTSTMTTTCPRARFELAANPETFIWVKFENVKAIRQLSATVFTLLYEDGADVMVKTTAALINDFWGMGEKKDELG